MIKLLSKYIDNLSVKKISLNGISEELKEKIANLEGQVINECCCNCLPDPDCGNSCCDCTTCEEPIKIQCNSFGRFNSEEEITRELDTTPKVMTLYDIHNQFDRFNFVSDVKKTHTTPLYFGYKNYDLCGEVIHRENGDMPNSEANSESVKSLYDVVTCQNKKIYKAVTEIVSEFDLRCPTIQTKLNGEVQVYTVKHTGTNGKENSIKSSLEEIAKLLNKLESRSDIKWSQVLDVSIDNIDDLYTFLVTFVFNAEKVRETMQAEKLVVKK